MLFKIATLFFAEGWRPVCVACHPRLLPVVSVCHGALVGTCGGGDGQCRVATAFSSMKLGRALCHPLIWLRSPQPLSGPPKNPQVV